MFFLPERAEPPAEIHELPVESRQLIGALRFSSLGDCSSLGCHSRSTVWSTLCWAQSSEGPVS